MSSHNIWKYESFSFILVISRLMVSSHLFHYGSSTQVYDDTSEGRKVCTYYKLDSIPVVLIIDPITGQKMYSWAGMVQPESLLEVRALCVFLYFLCSVL
jgi:hypothetical protein